MVKNLQAEYVPKFKRCKGWSEKLVSCKKKPCKAETENKRGVRERRSENKSKRKKKPEKRRQKKRIDNKSKRKKKQQADPRQYARPERKMGAIQGHNANAMFTLMLLT